CNLLIGAILLLTTFPVFAEGKVVVVEGEAEILAPPYMTPAEAKALAIEKARVDALRKAFGVAIGVQNHIITTDDGDRSETQAFSLSQSETNGDWIDDIDIKDSVNHTEAGDYYKAHVKGHARRIEHQPIDIDVRLLCNGVDKDRDVLRADEYHNGDDFYLYFNSPVGGWLTVYIADDDEANTMQAILPYIGQKEKAYRIEPDKDYIFFSRPKAEESVLEYAGGMKMYARKRVDFNCVYVIFSPNEFSRSSTSENRSAEQSVDINGRKINLMPRETTYKKFHKWLGETRRKDSKMQVMKIPIKIKKIN
ncbi:MAG: hypothetical protein K2K47_07340, partial [Duncaniella sp.]|nr:hypothetical protein [Duncaniella sp.]